jgi:N-acetylglucosamine malate deacetylase 1
MNILCISAHPDDETLGCGGTLLRHKQQADNLYWLIMTETFEPVWDKKTIKIKSREIDNVAKAYQMKSVYKLKRHSGKLDVCQQDKLIGDIKTVINKTKPQWIYCVHKADVHTDHRETATALSSAVKPFYMKKLGVQKILWYETLSSTEAAPSDKSDIFRPNVFIDISSFIKKKTEIMQLYKTEMQNEPLPRTGSAITALARYRGASVGVKYAEAFELARELI